MINNVTLQGRLTFDPERRKTPTDIYVTRFQIASERPYKNKSGEYQADFIDAIAWRSTGDFVANHFKKGDMINIVGRIETNNYVDKDGNNRKNMYVKVIEVSFGGSKRDEKHSKPVEAAPAVDSDFEPIDDDLPFEPYI